MTAATGPSDRVAVCPTCGRRFTAPQVRIAPAAPAPASGDSGAAAADTAAAGAFPFCCERCKLIDLGKWLTEGVRREDLIGDADYQHFQKLARPPPDP